MPTSAAPELRRLDEVRITKGLVVGTVVLAVAVGVGVAFALAGHPPGPSSSWVPLAPGVRVADSANEWFPANVGGPAPGYPYTDLVLFGRRGTSVRSLMRAEYATLRRDGWIYRGTYPNTGVAPVPVGTRGSDMMEFGQRHLVCATFSTYPAFGKAARVIPLAQAERGGRPAVDLELQHSDDWSWCPVIEAGIKPPNIWTPSHPTYGQPVKISTGAP
jgi:hypothetical protein